MSSPSILTLLDEIRAIAQLGLNYSKDPFDTERYKALLAIASKSYAEVGAFSIEEIRRRFSAEIGHITTKTGVNGVVFSDRGELFLTRRGDDNLWELPGGWVEVGESPQEAIVREFSEETSTTVSARKVIEVFSRVAGQFGQLHSSCHILIHCEPKNFKPQVSPEVSEFGYFSDLHSITWHRDHGHFANVAQKYWRDSIKKK